MKTIENPTIDQIIWLYSLESKYKIRRVELLIVNYEGDSKEEYNGYWCELDYIQEDIIAFEGPGSTRNVQFCEIKNIKAVRRCSDEYIEGYNSGFITGWNKAPAAPKNSLGGKEAKDYPPRYVPYCLVEN